MSTECPVCIEPYNGNEKVLSCRHSLCANCSDEIQRRQPYQSALNTVGEENVKCPICRQVCEPTYEELVTLVLKLKEDNKYSVEVIYRELQRNKKMVDVVAELMKYREHSRKMMTKLIEDNEMMNKELNDLRGVAKSPQQSKKDTTRLLCQATSECQTRTICRCSHVDCNTPACRGCGKKCAQHRV